MEKNKTEYRIVPRRPSFGGFGGDIWLQFKDKKKILWLFEVPCWRYVPAEVWARHTNMYKQASKCELDGFSDPTRAVGTYFGLESILISFTQKYPNIEDYFEYLKQVRKYHLETYDPEEGARIRRRDDEEKRHKAKDFKAITINSNPI